MGEREKSSAGSEPSAAFTPGPWVVQHDLIVSLSTYDTVCAVKRPCNGAWTVNVPAVEDANARLIAVAPELYEALSEAVAFAERLVALFEAYRPLSDPTETNAMIADWRRRLSKAEPQS